MKPFKINKIEEFAIKKPLAFKVVSISIFVLLYLSLFMLATDENEQKLIVSVCIFCVALMLIYPSVILVAKNYLANDPSKNYLKVGESLNRTNYLLSILNEKNVKEKELLCSNRIAYLINMGEFEQAKEEISLFKQTFNIDKNPVIAYFFYYNNAILNLIEDDIDNYTSNMKSASFYKAQLKGMDKIEAEYAALKNANYIDAHFTENPNFENDVTEYLNKNPKLPVSFFETQYIALFIYFRRLGNKEKAIQYANYVLQVANCNYELYDCRVAKEFLDNAN